MARLCEPAPPGGSASQTHHDPTPMHGDGNGAVSNGVISNGGSSSGSLVEAATVAVGGVTLAAPAAATAAGAAVAVHDAKETEGWRGWSEAEPAGGSCGSNGGILADNNGTRGGGVHDGNGMPRAGSRRQRAAAAAAATATAGEKAVRETAGSTPVAGVVAVTVEEVSPNLPVTGQKGPTTTPGPSPTTKTATTTTTKAGGVCSGAGARGGAVEGGRSRRRRKNAAKTAAAEAAAAAAAAKKNDAAGSGDEEEDVDVEDVLGVVGGSGGGGLANGRAVDVCEEDDEGNVEYKLKLVNPPLDRLEHLFTQMNWRLNEGRGECMYMLGYEDDGKATGMSPSEMSASIKTLRVMMEAVGAKIANMQVQAGAGGKKLKVARVTVVRQTALFDGLPPGSERRGLRVGVLGHAGAGKSTLVSVLTRGMSDNGRGLARMQVFRHNHEVFNGQTSSISQQALTLPLSHRETAGAVAALSRTAPAALGGDGRRSKNAGGGLQGGSPGASVARNRRNGAFGGGDGGGGTGVLSSSFPRSLHLGGASASNGFASAWARRGNGSGNISVGGSGGGRRRGDSLDESGGRSALRRRLGWQQQQQQQQQQQREDEDDDDEEEESRVVTFIDQPGHEKYLKTTLTGMTASALDYSMLVVSGVDGVQRMTREHLAIALALQLPIFVVMTKSDVAGILPPGTISSPTCPPEEAGPSAPHPPPAGGGSPLASAPRAQHPDDRDGGPAGAAGAIALPLRATVSPIPPAAEPTAAAMKVALQGLDRVLLSCMGRRAKVVRGVADAEAAADALRGGNIGSNGSNGSAAGDSPASSWSGLVPVMQVSSVTADGFAELRAFLGRLSPPEPLEAMYKEARGKAAEVRISNTFMVEGVGEVYAGNVVSGTVSVGDRLLLGPTGPNGAFVKTAVASVHVARLAVRSASAGQTASFTLVTDPDSEEEEEDEDDDRGPANGPLAAAAVVGINGEGDPAASAAQDSAVVPSDGDGGLGTAAPALHGGPLPYDGGGCSAGGGAGDGESPSKRTRKGMVLVEATNAGRPNTSYEFEAEVMILHHPGVIRENYQPVVHAHNICQSARITSMVLSPAGAAEPSPTGASAPAAAGAATAAVPATGIKSGERAVCRFRFLYRPEYLSVGTTIVLREGRTRGFGKVISVSDGK